MSVDRETVLKIAKLASLYFKEGEIETAAKDLNQILEYVEKLAVLDTNGTNPTFQVSPIENVYRDDIVQESLDLYRGKFFTVPKIIE